MASNQKLKLNIGQRVGALVLLRIVGRNGSGPIGLFKCDCGRECELIYRSVSAAHGRGKIASCGCIKRQISAEIGRRNATHGLSNSPLYDVYRQMIARCYSVASKDYPAWGGRGIAVCDPWRDNIHEFFDWAYASGYKKGVTIERYNNNDGYHPLNCRWIPNEEQARNTRRIRWIEYNGERKSVADWSRDLGIPYRRILARLNYNWPIDRLFT